MMFFSRTFPKALLAFILVLSVFVISVAPVHAAWPWEKEFWDPCGGFTIGPILCGALNEIAESIIKGLTGVINGLILLIAGLFFWLANQLIGVALDLNNNLALGKESIVNTGHEIVLGVANAGFIVALVVIAFATMLRWESFNYKKALPRVIIAALLINFGYFIVTDWLISPVNQITEAFRSASNFDPSNSYAVFKDAVGIGRVAEQNIGGASGVAGEAAKSIASVLFTALFSFFGILALMAFAVMLFIRYIALSILVILLPIAWIAWIFPNLKVPGGHPWTVWWENFTRWLLFAPFAMFFFYLATGLANTKGFIPPADENFTGYLGGAILIVGLLLGGLIVSNRMGISGGAMALGAAAAMRGWVQAKGRQLGIKYGYGAFKGAKGYEAAKRLSETGAKRGFLGKALTAPVRATGRQAIRTTAKAERLRQDALRKKFEGVPPFMVADMYEGLNDQEKMAAVDYMLERGYQWELPEQWTKDLARWSREDLFSKRGRKKLELDAFDKGYSAEVLAADEALEKAKTEGAPTATIQELEDNLDRAWEKLIKILGHRGVPNIDPRIISGEGNAFDKELRERYRSRFVRTTMEQLPTAMNALFSRSRGGGATFLVDEIERGVEEWDRDFLVPFVMERDKLSMGEAVATVAGWDQKRKSTEVTDNWTQIWPDKCPGALRIIERLNREIVRIEADVKLTDEVRTKRVEELKDQLKRWEELGPNQAVTRLNSLYTAGKRAYFFPFVGGEGTTTAPAPPA